MINKKLHGIVKRTPPGETIRTWPVQPFKQIHTILDKLLEECHVGTLQLPDFQRSWVWDEDGIKSLIA
jgi:hypothetical protein